MTPIDVYQKMFVKEVHMHLFHSSAGSRNCIGEKFAIGDVNCRKVDVLNQKSCCRAKGLPLL